MKSSPKRVKLVRAEDANLCVYQEHVCATSTPEAVFVHALVAYSIGLSRAIRRPHRFAGWHPNVQRRLPRFLLRPAFREPVVDP